jgi:mono/diheme cytochrome c family protein
MTLQRRILLGAAAIVGVVAVAVLAFMLWIVSGPGAMAFAGKGVELAAYTAGSPTGPAASLSSADPIARGKYLAEAADCAACHTVPGGTPFAGGRTFRLPFGTLYTSNITPDRETGIGGWTDAEFLRAVHKGVGKGDKPLYPAFPYPSYTLMTDADVLAIKGYLFSLQPVRRKAPENTLVFPFNQRWLMRIWAAMFNPDHRFRPVPDRSPQWNRGAYLIEAAAHCGDCHTPRSVMQAVDNRRKFGGGVAEGWNAYNISQDRGTGVGDWTAEELAAYIGAGHAAGRGTASGPMAEAVELSFRHMTLDDVAAIVTYLRTVPPVRSGGLPIKLAGPASATPRAGPVGNPIGKRTFEGACASCHAWTGAGAMVSEAQLTGGRAVNDPSAANVAKVILTGTGRPGGEGPYMPSFAATYTDTEIAATANYVIARFGSKPSNITPTEVQRMRTKP